MFGNFVYQKKVGPTVSSQFSLIRKEDYVIGGVDIVGPDQDVGDQTIRADNLVWTVDTVNITADNG